MLEFINAGEFRAISDLYNKFEPKTLNYLEQLMLNAAHNKQYEISCCCSKLDQKLIDYLEQEKGFKVGPVYEETGLKKRKISWKKED